MGFGKHIPQRHAAEQRNGRGKGLWPISTSCIFFSAWKGVATRALRPQPLYLTLSTAVTVPFLSHHTLQCHLPFPCTLAPLAPEFLLPSGGPHTYFTQQAPSPGHRVLPAPGRAVRLPRNSFHVIDFHANISGPRQALLL